MSSSQLCTAGPPPGRFRPGSLSSQVQRLPPVLERPSLGRKSYLKLHYVSKLCFFHELLILRSNGFLPFLESREFSPVPDILPPTSPMFSGAFHQSHPSSPGQTKLAAQSGGASETGGGSSADIRRHKDKSEPQLQLSSHERTKRGESTTRRGMEESDTVVRKEIGESGTLPRRGMEESGALTRRGMEESGTLVRREIEESDTLARRGMDGSDSMARRGSEESGTLARRGMEESGTLARKGVEESGSLARRLREGSGTKSDSLAKRETDESDTLTRRGVEESRTQARRGMEDTGTLTRRKSRIPTALPPSRFSSR